MSVLPPVVARDDGVLEADAVVPRMQAIRCPCGQPVAFWTSSAGLGTDPPGATVIAYQQPNRVVGFGFCRDAHVPSRTARRRYDVRARKKGTPALGTIKAEPAGTVRLGRVS